jgi:hypothetical protein
LGHTGTSDLPIGLGGRTDVALKQRSVRMSIRRMNSEELEELRRNYWGVRLKPSNPKIWEPCRYDDKESFVAWNELSKASAESERRNKLQRQIDGKKLRIRELVTGFEVEDTRVVFLLGPSATRGTSGWVIHHQVPLWVTVADVNLAYSSVGPREQLKLRASGLLGESLGYFQLDDLPPNADYDSEDS